ncbi:hypothetical protein MNV49_003606 [Pseudohyphozyma bogoriensis]|nr:hypothetical protein MNV49_003606 [Pseudohyphozyma bogoriensis]
MQRSRARSPDFAPVFRYRIILPDRKLIPILIGETGFRSKEIMRYSGVIQFHVCMDTIDEEHAEAPVAELIGTDLAIHDGLRAIATHLKNEWKEMSLELRDACGDIDGWAVYDERGLVDVKMSKREAMARFKGANKGDSNEGRSRRESGGDGASVQVECLGDGQKVETTWSGSRRAPVDSGWPQRHTQAEPGVSTPKIDSQPSPACDNHPRVAKTRPFLIKIPDTSVSTLIGRHGVVIQGIQDASNTCCSLITEASFIRIWGSRNGVRTALSLIHEVVLERTPTWDTSADVKRLERHPPRRPTQFSQQSRALSIKE